jgi:hypothetical protein
MNFVLLDLSHPNVVRLGAAMLQARDAVERRSWSHPQEPSTEEWWADVLNLLDRLAAPDCPRLGSQWDRCGVYYVEPIEGSR